MLLSLDWLKDFVNIPKNTNPKKLGDLLTMHAAEVESVKNLGGNLNDIAVGKIVHIRKHPNADKLSLVEVDLGEKRQEVVCGAKNIYEGMLAPFAKVGALVRWHGEGELVKVEKVKIRGIESEGMICAAEEIGLNDDIDGIMDISETKTKPGTPLKKALQLNDVVLEIDNKSITHRPDLWSHLGVAMEISAILQSKFKPLVAKSFKAGAGVDLRIKIHDFKKCPRFIGVAVDNIKIEPSPKWMQNRLRAVGLRPINNIVDITNYVLYEIGQPMHAYDQRDVEGNMLGTRMAKDGEKFMALDDEERKLTKDDIVVIDSKRAVSLAGIMGGQNTEIKDDTTSVILEAANFDPTTVRKTSLRLGLRTDSSVRFEKGLDPNLPATAISRALELIFKLCPGFRLTSKIVDAQKFKLDQGPLKVSYQYLIDRIGVEIPRARVEATLKNLGFEVKMQKDDIIVKTPSWRATGDISIPEDIVEEVARIYGYNNIPVAGPKFDLKPAPINLEKNIEKKIKDLLALGFGMTEVYNYAFASEKQLEKLGVDCRDYIRISNALTPDQRLLKQSLVPNLIDKTKDNLRYFENFRLFEMAKVFYKKNFKEEKIVAGVLVENEEPFYLAKGIVENLGQRLGINFEYKKLDKYLYCNGVFVEVRVGKDKIGVLGEMDIKEKLLIGFFELKLKFLIKHYNLDREFKSLPRFPEVRLDLSVILDNSVEWADIQQTVFKTGGELVRQVELFDVYRGSEISENKKSLAFHTIYRSDDRTLESDEVDEIQKKIIEILKNKFGAKIRS